MNLLRHPPERRRRGVTLAAHGCCCCCCCCLHSLTGLVGSAVASVNGKTPEARRTVKLYWILFLVSTAVGVASIAVHEKRDGLVLGLVLGALGLPLAQLNASFLTLCLSMFVALDLRTLGRITWKGFWWGLIGFLIMVVPLMAMSYLK